MKSARKNYHYAVRFCKRNSDLLKTQKIAESLSNNMRQFWREISHLKNNAKHIPTRVDAVTDSEEIVEIFHHKFDCLYTSVPSSDDSISSLNDQITQLLPQKLTGELTVSVTDVEKALSKLKAGKSDGFLNLTSDNIKYAPKRLHVWLALLFNSMLVHGFSPQSLLIGTMTPIPK